VKTRSTIAAISLAAVALAGGVGVGISYADDPTPTAVPTSTPSGQPAKRKTLIRRALHGEVTLAGAKHRVVDFQRGNVQDVSATSITVKSVDGFSATYVVTADTKVRKEGQPAEIAEIKMSDRVRVVAIMDGSVITARLVAEPKPR
jgi:hypothetical protein